MKKFGFYIIKDEYFTRFNDPYLKGNKEENRPHYYCFEDETNGLYWLIPMSSRAEKYKNIIHKKQEQHKPCDILHVCKLSNDREAVFLIQDMLPVTDKYILRPYTFAGEPLMLIKDEDRRIVAKKAKRLLKLIQRGVKIMPLQADVMKIRLELMDELPIAVQ
ncbi:MAG: hypothetical protein HDT25_08705 [Ruminococcus sp.]|nr:hypothetical protein [Ruminococcus sp.]